LTRLALLLAIGAACAQERPAMVSFARHGSRFLLQLREGAAELDWATSSTFRFRRTFGLALDAPSGNELEPVAVTVEQTPAEIKFTTAYLVANIRKDDLRLKVATHDGQPLAADATAAERRDGVISWERTAEPGVRYYGLGAHTTGGLNVRGMLVRDATPFLLTTAGYGEQHVARGRYDFDMERLRRGRYRIDIRDSDTIDYYFLYGPTPKEIFEERQKVIRVNFAPLAGSHALQWLVEQSLSGTVLPAETVTAPLPAALRKRLDAYLGAYIQEVYDRGYPILHPLPFQFAGDTEADKYPDESMLGDELLVGTGRSVYLPQGIWTSLKTNEVARGRQVVAVAEAPAVFARNGMIVPLAGEGTMELHYFPKLGAEFFLYEEDAGEYTQAHAAPAADQMRLEIESKVARDYTWVVHHPGAVKKVAVGEAELSEVNNAGDLRARTWRYDAAAQNLYVRDRVAAGEDHIVNLSFEREGFR
jgi:alpha-glucosidase (family GH31 glycosyl hydrolase)